MGSVLPVGHHHGRQCENNLKLAEQQRTRRWPNPAEDGLAQRWCTHSQNFVSRGQLASESSGRKNIKTVFTPVSYTHLDVYKRQRADIAQLEPDVLALPASLSVFADRDLNRDLYIWLAIQSACFDDTMDWIADNCRATQLALAQFPGFHSRYHRLLDAHLAQRPTSSSLRGLAAQSEACLLYTSRCV